MFPILVAKENTPYVLEHIGQDIAQVVAELPSAECHYAGVVQDLYNARRQLWVLPSTTGGVQGWLVTKIERDGDGVVRLILDLMGGEDVDELLTHLEVITNWAMSFDAVEVRALVRPGLRKKLKQFGFYHKCDMVVKSLKGKLH